MANPKQLNLFGDPAQDYGPDAGFFSEPVYDCAVPPKKESNATKKRNKRRAWYLQTVLKQPKADG